MSRSVFWIAKRSIDLDCSARQLFGLCKARLSGEQIGQITANLRGVDMVLADRRKPAQQRPSDISFSLDQAALPGFRQAFECCQEIDLRLERARQARNWP